MLLAFALAACGGNGGTEPPPGGGNGEPPPPPPPPTASVSGTVTHADVGVGDVVLRLMGPGNASLEATTPDEGTYSFDDLAEGTWTLEIEPPGYFRVPEGDDESRELQVAAGASVTADVELEPTEPAEDAEVDMGAVTFDPSDLTITPGTTVRWVNTVNDFHTITPDGHSAWSAGSVNASGEVFEVVINNPGDLAYYCDPHRALGMTGVVRVQP
jgi:plastocyanin